MAIKDHDVDAAFMRIIGGLPTEDTDENGADDFDSRFGQQKLDSTKVQSNNSSAGEAVIPPSKQAKKKPDPKPVNESQKEIFIHKAYDITTDQYKALKLRAINDSNLNLSGHLRAALDAYLKPELEMLRSSKK